MEILLFATLFVQPQTNIEIIPKGLNSSFIYEIALLALYYLIYLLFFAMLCTENKPMDVQNYIS